MKEDLVDFLGSDVHRENTIYPKIPKAIQKISKYISEEKLEELINSNAEKILNGENIELLIFLSKFVKIIIEFIFWR